MFDYLQLFNKLKNIIKENRRLFIFSFITLFFFVGFNVSYAAASDTAVAIATAPATLAIGILASLVNILVWAVGQLIITVIGMLVIPILGYNNFANSGIIDIGWPLVRDVVNMFVIVVLLVIAIKTMISSKSANWEQQLPRLFIAVILVNFSRTITLLIVDASQVVMFSFVNALRDLAAGNFVNMFQISSMLSVAVDLDNPNKAVEMFGFLGTSYVTLVLLMVVLAVFIILAVVFIYRIILIWVLVILSPAAFFLQGIKDVLPSAGSAASQWWNKLVGVATLGPILVFFLWLGLATASSGSIATMEGFDTTPTADSTNLYSEIFNLDQFLSLFIGIILIMVGFQAASSAAGSMGGIAATLVNDKRGMSIVKNAVKMPAALGSRGVRVGARQLERRTGAFSKFGSGLTQLGQNSKIPGVAYATRHLGSGIESTAQKSNEAAMEASRERLKNKPASYRVAILQAAKNKTPVRQSDRDDVLSAAKQFATDKREREKQRKSMSPNQWAQHNKDQVANIVRLSKEGKLDDLDDAGKKAVNAFLTDNLHNVEVKDEKGVVDLDATKKVKEEIINNKDFDPNNISQGEVFEDGDVTELLKKKIMKQTKGKDGDWYSETAWEQIQHGNKGGSAVRSHFNGEGAVFAKFDNNTPSTPASASEQPNASIIQAGLRNGHLDIASLTVDRLNANKENVVQGVVLAGLDINRADLAVRREMIPEIQRLEKKATNPGIQRQYRKAHFSAETDIAAQATLGIDSNGNFNNSSSSEKTMNRKALNEIATNSPIQMHKVRNRVDSSSFNDTAQELVRSASAEKARSLADILAKAQDAGDRESARQAKEAIEAFKDSLDAEHKTLSQNSNNKDAIKANRKKRSAYSDALRYSS